MHVRCRACLSTTEEKMYHSLSEVFPVYLNTSLTVLDLLELVTSMKVGLLYDLPDMICTACLKQLKECYNFIEKFKNCQLLLQENLSQNSQIQEENIILKVENKEDSYSPIIPENELISVFETGLDNEMIPKYSDTKGTEKKAKKEKTGEQRLKSVRRRNISRPLQKNKNSVILMSIEDVIKEENTKTEHTEKCDERTFIQGDSSIKVEQIHNDHTYQKISETPETKSNILLMSVKDVLNSTKKIRKTQSSALKVNKGIVTPSLGLVKRKIITRKARGQNVENKEGEVCICEICHTFYKSHKRLLAHKYAVHVSEWREKFKCGICGLLCKTRSAYTHHKLKHKGKQFKCDQCKKVYLTSTQLKEHQTRVHGDGVPAKYLCNQCGKRFKFTTGLKYHLSVHHTNDKPFTCSFCNFKCAQKSYMKRHERCHTDERPYKCKFCDRTFRGTAELQAHQLTHEGKVRYNCEYCGKGFIQRWNMKVHWLQHEGNSECEICNKNFIDEAVLRFHYFHNHKIKLEENVLLLDTPNDSSYAYSIF